jgi:predicted dehydrogenase
MDKSVRIGIIGTSWWVELMYVPSFTSHPAVRVVGVCGRNEKRAKEIAAKFGDAKVFTDYHQLIDSGDLDAIVIASPDDLHHEMAIAAIDAGLHVLCEKPLAGNAAHARELWERAEAAQVKHMVLFTWRWQPHWRYLKELVESGFVGRCYHAEFEFLSSFALDSGYKWRFDGDRANGITGDLGSHMIDFARWYLGEVGEVMADLTTFVDQSATAEPPPAPANDVGLLTLKFVSGARAQIRVSATSRLGDEGVRIIASLHGEAGTIEVCHTFFGADAGVVFRGARAGDTTFTPLDIPTRFLEGGIDAKQLFDPYMKQSAGPRSFVDAILSGSDPVPGFDVGVAIQEVVDAALKSSTEKRWVSLIDERASAS